MTPDQVAPVAATVQLDGYDGAPRTGLVRIGTGLLLGTVAWSAPFAAATAVLIPARIAEIDPDHKVGLLAALTAVAALVALVSNIVLGGLSDRTRTRLGARAPWLLGGAAATAILMAPLGAARSFPVLLAVWCATVVALNAATAGWNAVLADRVPVSKRATLSSTVGLGILLGTAVGTILGAAYLDDVRTGLVVVGVTGLVLALVTVVVAPDHASPRAVEPATAAASDNPHEGSLALVRASFALPRQAPDFYWALAGRLALVLGYFMVNGYQLYIFTDHVGLDGDEAARALALNAVFFLGAAVVGTLVAGPVSDLVQRRKVFVVAASLLSVVAIALPLVSATVLAMAGFALVGGVAFGAYYSVDAALMTEVLPDEAARARDLGVLNAANTGGQALAPVASSVLLALGLGFGPVFLGAMATCAIGAALVVPIRSVR